MSKSIWYDLNDLLSKNRLFSFIIGNRGGGKTFNSQKWAIKDFLKNGRKFIWLRRYESEVKEIKNSWCPTSLKNEFPNNTITTKGKYIYVDDKQCGVIMALSTSQRVKSVAYEEYDKIIFDEFLIDKGSLRYLKDEPILYLEFFESVARMRDNVRGIFIANAISIVNPYFTHFKIKPKLEDRFTMNKHCVIELYKNEEYIKAKKKTKFGSFVDGTSYGEYALDNKFLRDDYTFVMEKRPSKLIYTFGIRFNGKSYGVWVNLSTDKDYIYIDNIIEENNERMISFTYDDLDSQSKFRKHEDIKIFITQLKYFFNDGRCYFNNMNTKKEMFEVVKML